MMRRNLAFAVVLAVAMSSTALQAAPVFFLSMEDAGATPGLINKTDLAPGATGMLNIWANSDVRLSGVSLDLVETGGGVRFGSPATIPNPSAGSPAANRWAFTGDPAESDSSVLSIDGAAIPGLAGNGIGAGSPEGASVLFASVPFTANGSGVSNLQLRVGQNTIADWDGNAPMVHFGTASAAGVPGGTPGGAGPVGMLGVGGGPELMITDATIGPFATDTLNPITHTFQANIPVNTWNLVSFLGPGGAQPVSPPTFSPTTGVLSWSARFADLGGQQSAAWIATVGGTAGTATDQGTLTINLVIPEPATLSLVGLAMVGLVGLVRRRS